MYNVYYKWHTATCHTHFTSFQGASSPNASSCNKHPPAGFPKADKHRPRTAASSLCRNPAPLIRICLHSPLIGSATLHMNKWQAQWIGLSLLAWKGRAVVVLVFTIVVFVTKLFCCYLGVFDWRLKTFWNQQTPKTWDWATRICENVFHFTDQKSWFFGSFSPSLLY